MEKKQEPNAPKFSAPLWPAFVIPFLGVPLYFGFAWLFTHILSPRHDNSTPTPELYAVLASLLGCTLAGSAVGARFARNSPYFGDKIFKIFALGLMTGMISLLYMAVFGFGACCLDIYQHGLNVK